MGLNETQIVKENTDLVSAIARKYVSYGIPLEDLMQEGFIGLLLAARKWRADGGASLRTYAAPRIAVHIRRLIGVDRAGKIVPLPFEKSLDTGLDSFRTVEDEDRSLHDLMPSSSRTPEELVCEAEQIDRVLGVLTDRELTIIAHRYSDQTLRVAGEAAGVSHAHADRIERRALSRMRAHVAA